MKKLLKKMEKTIIELRDCHNFFNQELAKTIESQAMFDSQEKLIMKLIKYCKNTSKEKYGYLLEMEETIIELIDSHNFFHQELAKTIENQAMFDRQRKLIMKLIKRYENILKNIDNSKEREIA